MIIKIEDQEQAYIIREQRIEPHNIGLQGSEVCLIIIVYPILIQQLLEILDLRLKVRDTFILLAHRHFATNLRLASIFSSAKAINKVVPKFAFFQQLW